MEKKKLYRNVWITGLTSFFTDVSSEMVYPIISLYLKAMGGGPEILGIIEGLAESTASLLKVFSGAIADKIGKRKPIAILGYTLSLIGKFIFFLAGSWIMILAGRVVDRIGKGTRGAPRDAMIAESTPESERGKAYGIHRTLDTAGAVLGAAAGYFIVTNLTHAASGSISIYKTLIFVSLLPAALGVIILFLSIETGQTKKKEPITIASLKELPSNLKIFFGIILFFTLGNSSNQFIFLRAAEPDLGFTPAKVILLYLLFNIVETIVSYPAGYLSDKIGRKALISLGFFAYGITYFLIAIFPASIWLAMGIYGIYTGATSGVTRALVSELALPEKKATILGLHATIEGIGLLPASLFAGFLWRVYGHSAPFIFGGITGIAAALGIMLLINPGKASS